MSRNSRTRMFHRSRDVFSSCSDEADQPDTINSLGNVLQLQPRNKMCSSNLSSKTASASKRKISDCDSGYGAEWEISPQQKRRRLDVVLPFRITKYQQKIIYDTPVRRNTSSKASSGSSPFQVPGGKKLIGLGIFLPDYSDTGRSPVYISLE